MPEEGSSRSRTFGSLARARDLEAPPVGLRQLGGRAMSLLEEAARDGLEQVCGDLGRGAQLGRRLVPAQDCVEQTGLHVRVPPDDDVVEDRQVAEETARLKCSSDALANDAVGRQTVEPLALEPDLSRGWLIKAGDDVQQRRLAGPVGTDDPEHFALAKCEVDLRHRDEAPEAHGKALALEDDRCGHRQAP
jgi:hypothetical protein